jgi:predicted nuclease with TOPRIM domain
METGTISLVISGFVAVITVLKFVSSMAARKEANDDKFAKADAVTNHFTLIKNDIAHIEEKMEDHGQKISNLQVGGAVLSSQVAAQLREVEKLGDKLDEWRNNE